MNPIPDQVIRARRRTISLTVTPDARLVVRAPVRMPDEYIRRFVAEKKGWIETKLARAREYREANPPKQFRDGETFPFCGRDLFLRVSPEYKAITAEGDFLHFPAKFLRIPQKKLTQWYRKQALELIRPMVEENCRRHGFSVNGLRINGALRRWGSCGPRNTLNFSWRLALAPPAVVNYVVIHELCHTLVKDHSARFWAKVRVLAPENRDYRAWLRKKYLPLEF